MRTITIALAALIGSAGLAVAEPAPMTDAEMDAITAGSPEGLGSGGYTRIIVRANYTIVYDGTSWSVIFN